MKESGRHKYPLTALVIANSIPLAGVLFFGWGIFNTMAIYWAECVIVAVIAVLKMIACCPSADEIKRVWTTVYSSWDFERLAIDYFAKGGCNVAQHEGSKLANIGMFIIFSGAACYWFGYLLIVFIDADHMPGDILDPSFLVILFDQIVDEGLVLSVIGFAVSHMISFFRDYIVSGGYRRTVVLALYVAPLGRFVLLHMALVFGFLLGVAIMFAIDDGTRTDVSLVSMFVPIVLIVIKTLVEIKLHLRENHRHNQTT